MYVFTFYYIDYVYMVQKRGLDVNRTGTVGRDIPWARQRGYCSTAGYVVTRLSALGMSNKYVAYTNSAK